MVFYEYIAAMVDRHFHPWCIVFSNGDVDTFVFPMLTTLHFAGHFCPAVVFSWCHPPLFSLLLLLPLSVPPLSGPCFSTLDGLPLVVTCCSTSVLHCVSLLISQGHSRKADADASQPLTTTMSSVKPRGAPWSNHLDNTLKQLGVEVSSCCSPCFDDIGSKWSGRSSRSRPWFVAAPNHGDQRPPDLLHGLVVKLAWAVPSEDGFRWRI